MKAALRRAGLALAAVAVLPVLGLVIGEASGWRWLRGPLQNAASRAAQVPVSFEGRFRARLFGRPRLEVEQFRVGAGGGPTLPPQDHLADGRGVTLAWRWSDLWRWYRGDGPLALRSFRADTLDLRLVRDAQGHASWQLGRRDAPGGAAAPAPRIGSLTVRDGHIGIDDALLQTRLEVRIVGAEKADGGGAYSIGVAGTWRAQRVSLGARTGGMLPLLLDDADADADADADPDADAPAALALALHGTVGDVTLAFDGTAAALLGNPRLAGTLELAAPSLAVIGTLPGVALPQTPPFRLTTRLASDAGSWTLHEMQAAIGRSRLGGELRYDTRRTPPLLAGRLSGPLLALADLGPAIGTPPPASPRANSLAKKAPARSVRVLPQRRFDLPKLQAMDADVQLAVDSFDFGSTALAPLKPFATHIVLRGGVLELQDLKAATAGGQLTGSSRYDGTVEPARWAAKLVFSHVDVDTWVRGLRAPPRGKDAPPAYLTGTLNADLDVTGRGRSTAEVLATLDGRALVTVHDGTISHLVTEAAGLDIAQALGVLVRGDRPLALRCAQLDLAVKNGVVTPRRAVIDNTDSTLRIGGSLNLADESLALAVRARPKDFSLLALRAPITVTGTLGTPRVGIEGGPLAGKVLGAVVLGAIVAPVAALLPLIDPGKGDEADACAALRGRN